MERMPLSRRDVLRTSAMGAVMVWVPSRLTGLSAGEVRRRVEEDRPRSGISKWELETPALCVDLDRLERNIRHAQLTASRNGIATRPHAKTHKCPPIARLQIDAGSVGICVAKLGEAEAMYEHGVEDILLTTCNVTPEKIRKAMSLRKWCDGFIQSVDNPVNARDLSDAAVEAGVVADVVIDVDPGLGRTGVTPGRPALELGRLVDRLPGLRLRGITAYDGASQHIAGFAERQARALERLAESAETHASFARGGLSAEIFSGGGTGTYNIDHETAGFTDVQCGSYVFMDAQYLGIGGVEDETVYSDFEPSLTVITTVLNANFEGRATADAGAKSLTINEPDPIIVGERGISYRARSDEFGSIRYDDPSRTYAAGDKLELIVPHCDPVVNLYDVMYGIRNDEVEVVWPIAARGRSQ